MNQYIEAAENRAKIALKLYEETDANDRLKKIRVTANLINSAMACSLAFFEAEFSVEDAHKKALEWANHAEEAASYYVVLVEG